MVSDSDRSSSAGTGVHVGNVVVSTDWLISVRSTVIVSVRGRSPVGVRVRSRSPVVRDGRSIAVRGSRSPVVSNRYGFDGGDGNESDQKVNEFHLLNPSSKNFIQ